MYGRQVVDMMVEEQLRQVTETSEPVTCPIKPDRPSAMVGGLASRMTIPSQESGAKFKLPP